jgi:phosphoribosylformylglycinamidine synthase
MINEAQPFGVAGSFFGEDQGLYLVTVPDEALAEFLADAGGANVPADPIGRTIKDRLIFELDEGDWCVSIADLRAAHEGFFPKLMGDTIA